MRSGRPCGNDAAFPASQRTGRLLVVFAALFLVACAEPQVKPSEHHLKAPAPGPSSPPELVAPQPSPLPPLNESEERFNVSVEGVAVKSLLYALARDGKFDVDIAPDVDGVVTLQAREQTLTQLLERIARQVDLRWELRGKTLVIERDTPILRHYRIDYVSMTRETESTVNVSNQVSGSAAGGGAQTGNTTTATVKNKSESKFWETLVTNVQDLLRETDKILPAEAQAAGSAPAGSSPSAVPFAGQTAAGATTPASQPAGAPPPVGAGQIPGAPPAAVGATRPLYREAASVIANPLTGVLSVRATSRQHEKVREFLTRALAAARRQVLIEATIVEVKLNREWQSGIDWKQLALGAGFVTRAGFLGIALDAVTSQASPNRELMALVGSIQADQNLTSWQKQTLVNQIASGFGVRSLNADEINTLISQLQAQGWTYDDAKTYATSQMTTPAPDVKFPKSYTETFTGGVFPNGQTRGFTVGYGNGSNFAAAIKLLGQYGDVRVISSPKITTLNNQPAVLRVVDNMVYFTVTANTQTGSTGASSTTYSSTPNTVAVGLVMSVQPQIDEGRVVTLSVRPTITRLTGFARDPNPALTQVQNLVPIVQTKELESIMRVPSGQIVMLGGLMEDSQERDSESFPGLETTSAAGVFGVRSGRVAKTELVIFLRPVVIEEPGLDGDYAAVRNLLPGGDFFSKSLLDAQKGRMSLP